jgi:hypothetical protein
VDGWVGGIKGENENKEEKLNRIVSQILLLQNSIPRLLPHTKKKIARSEYHKILQLSTQMGPSKLGFTLLKVT